MSRLSWCLVTLLLAGLVVGCDATVAQGGQSMASAGGPPEVTQPAAKPTDIPAVTVTPASAPTSTSAATAPAETKASPTAPSAPIDTATSAPTAASATTPVATPVATPTLMSIPISQDSARTEELVGRGLDVYREQYCGICHQLSAAETAGKFGPTHDAMGATAEQRLAAPGYNGAATTPGEYILESLIDPKAYLVPGYEVTSHHMPAYAHLEQGDLEALVQMLLHQR